MRRSRNSRAGSWGMGATMVTPCGKTQLWKCLQRGLALHQGGGDDLPLGADVDPDLGPGRDGHLQAAEVQPLLIGQRRGVRDVPRPLRAHRGRGRGGGLLAVEVGEQLGVLDRPVLG